MRHVLLVPLLAACGGELTHTLPTEEAPPPGAPLGLTMTTLTPGSTVSFSITDADPAEEVWLVRSSGGMGAGPCPPPLGGMCADVVPPLNVMGPYTASSVGVASQSLTLPAGAPSGAHVCFQAMALRGPGGVDSVKSPVVCRVIDGGPVSVVDSRNASEPVDGSCFYGSNIDYAMKHEALTAGPVGYAEIYTGEVSVGMTMAIWSHDATNDQPLAPLATGSWTPGAQNEWQGAPLDTTVLMNPGEVYWLVFTPNGQQCSRAATGTMVTYRGQNPSGSGTWNGPFANREMYRLCTPGGCP